VTEINARLLTFHDQRNRTSERGQRLRSAHSAQSRGPAMDFPSAKETGLVRVADPDVPANGG
jgi:hypothetical protein